MARAEMERGESNGFHPLKAGRRHSVTSLPTRAMPCFHPLKAGRRLVVYAIFGDFTEVFPSPQGGSETGRGCLRQYDCLEFPSPQGGSETTYEYYGVVYFYVVSIPSRRVGDVARSCWVSRRAEVSIPSRRVGDSHCKAEPQHQH